MTTVIVAPTSTVNITNTGYKDWWCPCGVAPVDYGIAYAAKGAGSYAASKVNLANPGVNDLSDGASFPSWSDIDGWIYSEINQLLTTPVILTNQDCTFIIKVKNLVRVEGYFSHIFGKDISVHDISVIDVYDGGSFAYIDLWFDGAYASAENDCSGDTVLAMNKNYGYVNGVAYPYNSPTDSFSDSTKPITIGAVGSLIDIKITSLAMCYKCLTQSQIQEIGSLMP